LYNKLNYFEPLFSLFLNDEFDRNWGGTSNLNNYDSSLTIQWKILKEVQIWILSPKYLHFVNNYLHHHN